jgi:hypothetical protein
MVLVLFSGVCLTIGAGGNRSGAGIGGRVFATQQQISVITLGVADLLRSRHFYVDGIAWNPVWPISPEGYVTFGT